MIELSEEFLAGVLGTTAGELTEALKDGDGLKGPGEIEAFLKSKFDEVAYRAKKSGHTEGHGRGLKESLTVKERELREKFDVDGKTIDEVIDNILAKHSKSTSSPDDVRNSETFINEVKKWKALVQEKEDALLSEKAGYAKTETMRVAKSAGLKILKEKNFVLPDDEEMAGNLIDLIFSKIEDENTKLSIVDGKLSVLDANGRQKENESGTKDITFDDHMTGIAKRYLKVAVSDNRKSPGQKTTDQNGGGGDGADVPELKSKEDLYRELGAAKGDIKKMEAIKAKFDELVKDGTIKD